VVFQLEIFIIFAPEMIGPVVQRIPACRQAGNRSFPNYRPNRYKELKTLAP